MEARLPADVVATEITVSIDEWGFLPARQVFPLRAQDTDDFEQVIVQLEPVEAAAWHSIRILRAGEGDTVAEAEALQVSVARRASTGDPLRRLVAFVPGSSRVQEVRIPFSPTDVEVKAFAPVRHVVENGRRVLLESPRVRVEPPVAEGPETPVFTVGRPPCAVLEFDVRYPPGSRPRSFSLQGSWSGVFSEPGPMRGRRYGTTFNVHDVRGETDVLRIDRDPGQLKSLRVGVTGFTFSLDPPPPYELRLSETTRVVLEFRRSP